MSGDLGEDVLAHLLAAGRQGEPLGYLGIALLALLDTPQACSRQNKEYARTTANEVRSRSIRFERYELTSYPAK